MNFEFLNEIYWGNSLKAYLVFTGILLFGLLFKKIVSRLLGKLLFRLFKNFATENNADAFIAILIKPFEFFILIATFFISTKQLRHPLDVKLFDLTVKQGNLKVLEPFTIGNLLDKIYLFLIIWSIFWIILRLVDFVAFVFLQKAQRTNNKADDQLVPFLKELLKFIVCFIGIFVLLGYVFEVNAVSLITGLGIGGIAIALAAKESLENLIGSFTIFLDKPFTVGDLVKVDGIEGTVEKVGFRSTIIRSIDKTIIVIPNRAMIDGVLENLTRRNYRRVKFTIGLVYETSNKQIQDINAAIKDYLNSFDTITDAQVILDGFGDSALNVQVLYLIENKDYQAFLETKEAVNFKVIEIVKQFGSDFAYPTQRSIAN